MHSVYLSTDGDTTTNLPNPLEVHGYGCGVLDLDGYIDIPDSMLTDKSKVEEFDDDHHKYSNNLFLCCDIVQESYVGKIKMPVLRYLKRKKGRVVGDIHNVIWLTVIRPFITSIRLYIADDSGKILSLQGNTVNCTLLFIPH